AASPAKAALSDLSQSHFSVRNWSASLFHYSAAPAVAPCFAGARNLAQRRRTECRPHSILSAAGLLVWRRQRALGRFAGSAYCIGRWRLDVFHSTPIRRNDVGAD